MLVAEKPELASLVNPVVRRDGNYGLANRVELAEFPRGGQFCKSSWSRRRFFLIFRPGEKREDVTSLVEHTEQEEGGN